MALKKTLLMVCLLASPSLWATTFVYVSNATSGSISRYQLDSASGALEKLHSWPNAVAARYQLAHGRQRPADYSDPTPRIWAADLKITPDGRFLYMSERTSSTVSGYRIDAQSGALTLIGSWPVEKQPRGMAIDGSGKWLLVSGEKSAVVGSYAINDKDGTLARVGEAACGTGANWVVTVTR
ncbi:lactonase family protein [Duffyella gerundensis]|uniref:lactonase family protein n=1 Tax=Duffyella TaxID=3026546 RepID=UPI003F6E041E